MAGFVAAVESTFQLSAAHLAAAYVSEPAWLILELIAAAEAWFRRQERTFGTMLLIQVTVV